MTKNELQKLIEVEIDGGSYRLLFAGVVVKQGDPHKIVAMESNLRLSLDRWAEANGVC